MSQDNKFENKSAQKCDNEKFNSITQKKKVENQNQTHNSKKEGTAPIRQY